MGVFFFVFKILILFHYFSHGQELCKNFTALRWYINVYFLSSLFKAEMISCNYHIWLILTLSNILCKIRS